MSGTIHATAVVLEGVGIAIRGPSGSGKSLLALGLLAYWELRGRPALLVADDQVELVAGAGGITMRTPPRIAGLIELRGRGIVTRPHVGEAQLHLVVDLVERLERMPEPHEFSTDLLGVTLPRCPVPRSGSADSLQQLLLVREAMASLQREREKIT